jgi:flagellin
MGLRIQNNIAAMNAHRQLGISDAGLSKSLERLSSGYRINRAADDAAGLSISSGFRADIASFKVASRNTSEANSLLQVAEGGMEQIENMLIRLKELATQASSANVGAAERTKINAEGNALIAEIDRIANSTEYGSTKLLDGSFGASHAAELGGGTAVGGVITGTYVGYTFSGTGTAAALCSATVYAVGSGLQEATPWYVFINTAAQEGGANSRIYLLNSANYSTATIIESYTTSVTGANSAITFANPGVTMGITGSITGLASVMTAGTTSAVGQAKISFQRTGLSSLNVEGAATGTYTFATADANKVTLGNGTVSQTLDYTGGTATLDFNLLGISFVLNGATEGYDDNDLEGMTLTVSSTGNAGSTFQIGAKNDENNRISLSISNVTAGASGLGLIADRLDDATEAQGMLTTIDEAISNLAAARGTIGASMNRLSYASANLATTIENMQAAESVIRDVDMASEMITFTKNQILMQAGTAMLAQANQAPQLILSLLGR